MDQCCSVIQLGYSQGIGEDQHGPSAVGAVREGSKIDAFGAFSRNAQVEIEVLVQDVSVHEREGGENYPVLGLIQGLETNEQVESPNVEWGRFRIVDTDSAAWWGGVEVQPGSPCDPTLRRSLQLLDLDAHNLLQVLGAVEPPAASMKHHVRRDQGAGGRNALDLFDSGEDCPGEKFVERVVLGVSLAAQPEGHWTPFIIEEPLSEPQKGNRWKIGQWRFRPRCPTSTTLLHSEPFFQPRARVVGHPSDSRCISGRRACVARRRP